MGFRKKDARKSDNRSKAKVIMGKPASQLSKEEKKILSARMAEIRSANGGKNTVQNTIPFLCMYKDGVCQVSENFFSLTVQFFDANYSISEFEEQNNIFSKYCDVINLFDNTIKFQLTFENQNRSKEKLVKTVQIPEQEDDFNAIRKEYSEMLTDKLISSSLCGSLEYIVDGNKTRDHSLVESFMCETDPVRAAEQFRAVRDRFGTGRSTTQAQHIIQSFEPEEVTPEKAMEIAQELCHRLLKEQYQYVIAVHEDHEHIHAHIIVNNTNMTTGKTFETEHNQGKKSERAWAELRSISDEICRENDLSVIQHPETSKGKSYWEWDMSRQGLSWKAKLKYAIDQVVKDSEDFEDFLSKCAAQRKSFDYAVQKEL